MTVFVHYYNGCLSCLSLQPGPSHTSLQIWHCIIIHSLSSIDSILAHPHDTVTSRNHNPISTTLLPTPSRPSRLPQSAQMFIHIHAPPSLMLLPLLLPLHLPIIPLPLPLHLSRHRQPPSNTMIHPIKSRISHRPPHSLLINHHLRRIINPTIRGLVDELQGDFFRVVGCYSVARVDDGVCGAENC